MRRILFTILVAVLLAAPATANITLTVTEQVRSKIGASGTIGYDTIRATSIRVDPQENTLYIEFELYVAGDNAKPSYSGTYEVDTGTGIAKMRIPGLGIDTGVTLTPQQNTGVVNNIDSHRDNVENSMISFGLVDGTQN
jgi:hypothetical protein